MGVDRRSASAAVSPAVGLSFSPARRLGEHAWIVCQGFQVANPNPPEFRMLRIEQPVLLLRRQGGGDHEHAVLASLHQFVTETSQLRRCCRISPIRRQLTNLDYYPAQVVRCFGNGEDQVARRVVFVKVNEIFKQGEGLVRRRIAQADARARPASPVTVGAFPIKRRPGVLPPKHPV